MALVMLKHTLSSKWYFTDSFMTAHLSDHSALALQNIILLGPEIPTAMNLLFSLHLDCFSLL
jgi:hypothetical protein